ncbi:MAG: type II toxin-antitoxin system Phd/YefM family antitoxin [Candidatus Sericytochromatia bacterium]|nr:type II toxin-antitoxin system Phd/YefM family antitoxin [Candidatus Tanganyikabacteria bacterium]
MPRIVKPTELRAHLFEILDQVLATGEPCEIDRGGRRLMLVPVQFPRTSRLDRPFRNALNCTFDELVETRFEYEPGDLP